MEVFEKPRLPFEIATGRSTLSYTTSICKLASHFECRVHMGELEAAEHCYHLSQR